MSLEVNRSSENSLADLIKVITLKGLKKKASMIMIKILERKKLILRYKGNGAGTTGNFRQKDKC